MLNLVPPSDCQTAREAASARVDGELSELEATRLELHLHECAACAEYLRDVEAIARELRTAPLERPRLQIELPRRRRLPDVRVAAAAAVAIASVAAVSSYAIGHAIGSGSRPGATTASRVEGVTVRRDAVDLHILAMLRRIEGPRTLRVGPLIML